MIYMYTGVPGSSKSLHIAAEICKALKEGRNVIANLYFNDSLVKDCRGCFIQLDNQELLETSFYFNRNCRISEYQKEYYSYILGLYNFAHNFHNRDSRGDFYEHQTLLVIDEAQMIFNPRKWNRNDRLLWVEFLTIHRHLGYDVILASQSEKNIDKQIFRIVQTVVEHRNVREYKLLGRFLAFLVGGNLFMHIYKFNGMSKKDAHMRSGFFVGSKYYSYYRSTQLY